MSCNIILMHWYLDDCAITSLNLHLFEWGWHQDFSPSHIPSTIFIGDCCRVLPFQAQKLEGFLALGFYTWWKAYQDVTRLSFSTTQIDWPRMYFYFSFACSYFLLYIIFNQHFHIAHFLFCRSHILIFPCSLGHVICLECFRQYGSTCLGERRFVEHPLHGYTLPCPGDILWSLYICCLILLNLHGELKLQQLTFINF